jgi:uncharacterized protein YutE (UPF0331/DUF86 family)
MDQPIIEEKLESLRKCMARVEQKRPSTARELENNLDLQDILSVNLERAVQLCVDIGAHIISHSDHNAPSSLGETFDILEKMEVLDSNTATQLKKAVGFRNIAVHAYQQLDWEIVFQISHEGMEDFKAFARSISKTIR